MELNQTFFLVWKVNCISVHKLYDVLLMFLLISRKNVSSFLPEARGPALALAWSSPGPDAKRKKKQFLAKNRRLQSEGLMPGNRFNFVINSTRLRN